ncbi:GGDEF domain-containing protein [Novosphingobium guangzhouense]|uniref:diguanylate cyclase n=1 Tax=Novosphingobium guangzhouense TaxID=1850347 RepID=A0A2K2G5I1_9SPHN|nr:GGDEF domain-containing protein [Novosphingobium guangzhouense]PNU06296.1 diguanylate cyclase [Novosphingobium guangzhouense]
MSVDAPTMLLLSNAIAFVAATFLLIEWRSLRERFLLSFALGFLSIVVGCTLAPLRQSGEFFVGVWLSNSMVPLAHFMFLHGAASFAQRKLSLAWFFAPLICSALMAIPGLGDRDQVMSLFNAGFVAVFCLRAAGVLVEERRNTGSETRTLVATLLFHGSFYAIKAGCAFVPGAFVNLSSYKGTMISISLFEGILVEVALAMSVAGALRRRREERATRLAESDPLTGLLNRRGFEKRTRIVQPLGGSLLLIDIDNFKTINDCFGHQDGDRLLVDLAKFLSLRLPASAVCARLGGDEFVVLVPGMDAVRGLHLAEDLCTGFAARQGPDQCGTLSIGCAAVPQGTHDLAPAMLEADRGLYEAKNNGRNNACLAPRSMTSAQSPAARLYPFAAAG